MKTVFTISISIFISLMALCDDSRNEEAFKYYSKFLKNSPIDEIRAIWFYNKGKKTSGQVMCINLKTRKITLWKDVYNWASQGTVTRNLSEKHIKTISNLMAKIGNLKSDSENSSELFLFMNKEKETKYLSLKKSNIPEELIFLYSIIGPQYFDVKKYAEQKDSSNSDSAVAKPE